MSVSKSELVSAWVSKGEEQSNAELAVASWAPIDERTDRIKEAEETAEKRSKMIADTMAKLNEAVAVLRVPNQYADACTIAASTIVGVLEQAAESDAADSAITIVKKVNAFLAILEEKKWTKLHDGFYHRVIASQPVELDGDISAIEVHHSNAQGLRCSLCKDEESENRYKITVKCDMNDLYAMSKWVCSKCTLVIFDSGVISNHSVFRDFIV